MKLNLFFFFFSLAKLSSKNFFKEALAEPSSPSTLALFTQTGAWNTATSTLVKQGKQSELNGCRLSPCAHTSNKLFIRLYVACISVYGYLLLTFKSYVSFIYERKPGPKCIVVKVFRESGDCLVTGTFIGCPLCSKFIYTKKGTCLQVKTS